MRKKEGWTEKKRPIGITIIGWLGILVGLLFMLAAIAGRGTIHRHPELGRGGFGLWLVLIGPLVLAVISVALGMGILKLKSVARNCLMILVTLNTLWFAFGVSVVLTNTSVYPAMTQRLKVSMPLILIFLIGILLLVYLIRPKVKEQFR